MSEAGILFVATGEKYIKAAIRAARTVPKFCPGLPIHLFADYRDHGLRLDDDPAPFTSVGHIDDPHRRSKVDYLAHTPFQNTLYLDSDTALNADIREVFDLLDRFDIALCHAHKRNAAVRTQPWRVEIPLSFPQFNSGVMVYKKSPQVLSLLDDWAEAFREAGFQQDQVTLRELLWLSDLRIATLPPEYNVRFMKYHYLWNKTEARTKIYHLRRFHEGRLWFIPYALKQTLRKFPPLFRLAKRVGGRLKND